MQVQPRNAELQALLSLQKAIKLKAMGCRFDRGPVGGVSVTLAGRGIGAWWYENGRYNFASIAYRTAEHSACTIDEVVAITATLANRHFTQTRHLPELRN